MHSHLKVEFKWKHCKHWKHWKHYPTSTHSHTDTPGAMIRQRIMWLNLLTNENGNGNCENVGIVKNSFDGMGQVERSSCKGDYKVARKESGNIYLKWGCLQEVDGGPWVQWSNFLKSSYTMHSQICALFPMHVCMHACVCNCNDIRAKLRQQQ